MSWNRMQQLGGSEREETSRNWETLDMMMKTKDTHIKAEEVESELMGNMVKWINWIKGMKLLRNWWTVSKGEEQIL